MKNSELIKLLLNEIKKDLRKIVREEIQIALNKKPVRNDSQTAAHGRRMMDLVNEHDSKSNKPKMQFSRDPILNDILNQTARTPKPKNNRVPMMMDELIEEEQQGSEYPTMGKQMLTSNDVNHFKTGMPNFGRQEPKPDATPEGVNPNALPDHLKKIFSRDYSGLVDAMAKDSQKKAK